MAIVKVKNESGRLLAHVRTHGNAYVSLSQVHRWSPDDVRLVAAALVEVVGESAGDASPTSSPASLAPAAVPPSAGPLKEPPTHGRGSSRVAWVDYARSQGVEVTGTMTREAIRQAVVAARSEARPGEVGGVAVAV